MMTSPIMNDNDDGTCWALPVPTLIFTPWRTLDRCVKFARLMVYLLSPDRSLTFARLMVYFLSPDRSLTYHLPVRYLLIFVSFDHLACFLGRGQLKVLLIPGVWSFSRV